MRCLLLLVFVVAATAADVPTSSDVDYIKNYHELVGIPLAAKIKAMEDQWLRNPLNRIIGGAASANINHPYMAGLVITLTTGGRTGCGATLLSSSRLVTAGHCWADSVNQAAQFEVVLGSQYLFSGGTRIITNQVFTHPLFDRRNPLKYDVAMIYLPSRVTFSALISPVALPSAAEVNDQFAGATATAIGYGKTSDAEVGLSLQTFRREVNVQVMAQPLCRASWGAGVIEPYNLCTEGNRSNNNLNNVGVCGGDSGGPLTTFKNGRQILIGVISFAADGNCQSGYASGYTRVTSFLDFITQHLQL
ncbi:hypothetical protein JYU34_013434 [Plutella xylostella]|uniref:Peptidase S1 domain-containing protein n=1 Tax=Plutella xylostella TaxID=51655 RepID=A0ABQ7QB36_PLUXY|nr:hypothetical protein JYU34_013434 [Plutella xylostella]